jgi:hypothetical protein
VGDPIGEWVRMGTLSRTVTLRRLSRQPAEDAQVFGLSEP